MKKFDVKTQWATYKNCHLTMHQYAGNGHIYIGIVSDNEGPIADMTVNIRGIERLPKTFSCVDTNNCPWMLKLIEKLGIGHYAYAFLPSGFCDYPVYEFDRTAIEKYVGG